MSCSLLWLSDDAWATIEPNLPKNQHGARRVDDRRVISRFIPMLKCGGRWADCPTQYGPSTTVDNRWNGWSRRNHLVLTESRASVSKKPLVSSARGFSLTIARRKP